MLAFCRILGDVNLKELLLLDCVRSLRWCRTYVKDVERCLALLSCLRCAVRDSSEHVLVLFSCLLALAPAMLCCDSVTFILSCFYLSCRASNADHLLYSYWYLQHIHFHEFCKSKTACKTLYLRLMWRTRSCCWDVVGSMGWRDALVKRILPWNKQFFFF